jgi:hypothetical protein
MPTPIGSSLAKIWCRKRSAILDFVRPRAQTDSSWDAASPKDVPRANACLVEVIRFRVAPAMGDDMKSTLPFIGVWLLWVAAASAQTGVAEPRTIVIPEIGSKPVEKAAVLMKKVNDVLGDLLATLDRARNRRLIYDGRTWWYWMPKNYWMVWDDVRWNRYRPPAGI